MRIRASLVGRVGTKNMFRLMHPRSLFKVLLVPRVCLGQHVPLCLCSKRLLIEYRVQCSTTLLEIVAAPHQRPSRKRWIRQNCVSPIIITSGMNENRCLGLIRQWVGRGNICKQSVVHRAQREPRQHESGSDCLQWSS